MSCPSVLDFSRTPADVVLVSIGQQFRRPRGKLIRMN